MALSDPQDKINRPISQGSTVYLCSGIQLQLIKEIFNQLNSCASIGIFFLKWKFEKLLYLTLVTQCSLKELGEICTFLWVCGAAIVVSQSQAG